MSLKGGWSWQVYITNRHQIRTVACSVSQSGGKLRTGSALEVKSRATMLVSEIQSQATPEDERWSHRQAPPQPWLGSSCCIRDMFDTKHFRGSHRYNYSKVFASSQLCHYVCSASEWQQHESDIQGSSGSGLKGRTHLGAAPLGCFPHNVQLITRLYASTCCCYGSYIVRLKGTFIWVEASSLWIHAFEVPTCVSSAPRSCVARPESSSVYC